MIGPSSSHTAGAVRIGKIVSSIFGEEPKEVEFQLFNSFAKTYRGHGTDLALVAGILGMDTDDPRIPDSLKLHMNEAFGLFGLFKKKAMLLTQTQRLLLLKMIIKRFLSPESQLVVGTYKLLS